MKTQKVYYDNRIVKAFLYASIFWAIIGFLTGLIIAGMLFFPTLPDLIFGKYIKFSHGIMGFGRWRIIHTTTVIFAFIGNIIFTGSYYSLQRLLRTRMYNDVLSWINFWGWQIFIILSWITFLIGITTSKEYSEHEWPIDIIITIIWIIYGINMIGTILNRKIKHLYVSIWFFLGTWISVAMLHIFNNLELPISIFSCKSYSLYAGVQDALIQWWYGHNAVAFILTTPILGLMYYFLPKASGQPIYSYKLSIIHFWSLIFIYIWAGPHHLLYTSLPEWVQILGTIFSIMLIAPSWGGMINGLLTLKKKWNKVKKDPILKFFVISLLCYGMATFEGPMLATKSLNSIAHFTDWIVSHVHLGTLGWNGFMAFGMIYWLIKKLWNTKLYSKKLANIHFWLGTLGIIIYIVSMYTSSLIQTNILKTFKEDGTLYKKNFLDSIVQIIPFYKIRFLGGILYFLGSLIMIFNIYKTIKKGSFKNNEVYKFYDFKKKNNKKKEIHNFLEKKPIKFIFLSLLVVLIGGAIEIIPTLVIKSNIPSISSIKPYSPLELEGRDIYIREGCNGCHSQIIRPFRDEVVRYGEYSKAGEFIYDHPFLWGSKRTGPDLSREGGKNPSSWHFKHLLNPRFTSPKSIMPNYSWLVYQNLDYSNIKNKMKTMVKLGVPYKDKEIENAFNTIKIQASKIEKNIYEESPDIKKYIEKQNFFERDKSLSLKDKEIIALIAYLQRLGIDIKNNQF